MTKESFYFVAERTTTRRGCTQDKQELICINADNFRAADMWINANYKGWIHYPVTEPAPYLFTATNFCAYSA
jgi:hypothetical protein